jgi:signal transduction histidine kinase/ActR/RegA family two-component response regulator
MTAATVTAPDRRVLLLALTAKDGSTTRAILQTASVHVEPCATFGGLLQELAQGAAAVAIAEEHLSHENSQRLAAVVREQPAWSDLPVLLLTRRGADSDLVTYAASILGNVTLLERPLRIATLVSAVRTAVRARERQYQIRSHMEAREQATEALRAADRRKDVFLATLAHELRNPLAPISTGLHMLRLVEAESRDSRLTKITDIMERQLSHLVRLVDDLLEVSRITRGVIDIRHETLAVADLLDGAVDTVRPMLEAMGHEFSLEQASEPLTVRGDPVRLTQVVTNLLANAAKYTSRGGRIALSARRSGQNVVISVRDNGIGISPAHLQTVFDLFVQVDGTDRRAQGGLGIGLTLVRSLVTMHGGTVEARSEGLGRGSEFIVTLPARTEQVEFVRSTEARPDFSANRILVVDDNRDAADTLADLLRALGATVAVDYRGRSALDRVPTFAPTAVLLDIGMPEMDGYEVARRLRESHPPQKGAPLLIALTGWGQESDYRRSELAGFDHHLVKPPNIEQLRALLCTAGARASPATH